MVARCDACESPEGLMLVEPLMPGGAREDRTPDLLRARQALSQLSYGPGQQHEVNAREDDNQPHALMTASILRALFGGSGWI